MKNSTLFMAYCLLAQVVKVKIQHDIGAIWFTLAKSNYTTETVVQMIPMQDGLTLFFTSDCYVNLHLNNNLYFNLLDDKLMSFYKNSRVGFIKSVLHSGLENGYALHVYDEVLMQLLAS